MRDTGTVLEPLICRDAWISFGQFRTYDAPMPGTIFWLLVIAAVLFFKLTTPAERRSMIETYWLIIIGLGAVGFIWQFMRQDTLSS